MQLGCYLLMLQFLLLFHFHISVRPRRIDPVQIRAPPVRNQTIPVLQSLENGNRASSFWNYEIPDPDQIGSGDGWSSTCTVENGWRWSRTAFPILNNQHKINKKIIFRYYKHLGVWQTLSSKFNCIFSILISSFATIFLKLRIYPIL